MVASCFMHAPLQCDCTVSLRRDRHVGSVGGGGGTHTRAHTRHARCSEWARQRREFGHNAQCASILSGSITGEEKMVLSLRGLLQYVCVCVCALAEVTGRAGERLGHRWTTTPPSCVTDNGGLLPTTSAATSTWCLERSERADLFFFAESHDPPSSSSSRCPPLWRRLKKNLKSQVRNMTQ